MKMLSTRSGERLSSFSCCENILPFFLVEVHDDAIIESAVQKLHTPC